MAEVIEMEIEQASEQEQRGREDEVVSVLSRLRPPVASDLSRKRKLVTNPGKVNRRSKSKVCSGIRVVAQHLWQITIFN